MFEFHPHPVPCRNCGTILQATYAETNEFRCPECGELVCYLCGCVQSQPCVVLVWNDAHTSHTELICSWAMLGDQVVGGTCSHCFARAVYEMYQEATGRPADDPFYMTVGRSAFGVKGLEYGI